MKGILHTPNIWVITYNPPKNEGFLGFLAGRKHIQKFPFPLPRPQRCEDSQGRCGEKPCHGDKTSRALAVWAGRWTNLAPKKGAFLKENEKVFQPSIFRCFCYLVSGRVAKKMLVHRRVHIPYSNFEKSTYSPISKHILCTCTL